MDEAIKKAKFVFFFKIFLIIDIDYNFFEIQLLFCFKYLYLQPIIIPKSRLINYFELSQLPDELGGSLVYNHDLWIQNREVCIKCLLI